MRFIGDIHGKVVPYMDLIADCEESIQVGDFGMGFLSPYQKGLTDAKHQWGDHRFIRGNHDDPAICKDSPGWIEDGHYDAERNMMFIGGAWSIDHAWRTPGRDWWADEELSVPELAKVYADYVFHKPKIVITHDAPTQAAQEMFFGPSTRTNRKQYRTRTAEALQAMFEEHSPDLWIFGHWHIPEQRTVRGTEFICLAELEHVDIDV